MRQGGHQFNRVYPGGHRRKLLVIQNMGRQGGNGETGRTPITEFIQEDTDHKVYPGETGRTKESLSIPTGHNIDR